MRPQQACPVHPAPIPNRRAPFSRPARLHRPAGPCRHLDRGAARLCAKARLPALPRSRWARPGGRRPQGAHRRTGQARRPRPLRARLRVAGVARGRRHRAHLVHRPGHRPAGRPAAGEAWLRAALTPCERHVGRWLRGQRVRDRLRGGGRCQARQHAAVAVRPVLRARRRGGRAVGRRLAHVWGKALWPRRGLCGALPQHGRRRAVHQCAPPRARIPRTACERAPH